MNRAMRIGTNHGSLSARILSFYGDTPRGMVESAFEFAEICRANDYHNFVFSMKASNPLVMVQACPPFPLLLQACVEALVSCCLMPNCPKCHPLAHPLPYHLPTHPPTSKLIFACREQVACLLQAYRLLAEEQYKRGWDYPLHLGVTEVPPAHPAVWNA